MSPAEIQAAARPFLRGTGAGHAPTAVVLIIDNSLSSGLVSGDRRVLDELKDRALETLNRAGPDDRFWLLRAGAPWEPALPGDAAAMAERVRETQSTAAAADIPGSVTRASSILAQGADGRAKEIQLLSDLQAANVRGAPDLRGDQDVRVLLWSPRRAEQPNASVGRITVGGGLAPRAGARSSVVAAIAGTGRDSVNVRLSIDGRIAGAAIAAPGAAALMPLPARPASLITGEVQIDADALRADDRRFFVATIAPPPGVVLTRPTPFIAEALAVLADARRIERAASNAEVLIAPAGMGTEAAGISGSVVVIAPESTLELPATNRRLAALGINWRLEQVPATGELRFANAGAGDELSRALSGVRVAQLYRLVPSAVAAQDSVMLRLENGMPWAVRGARARGGRFVLLASPLTIAATTLPASTAMIPLLDRLTGAWSSVDAPRAEIAPGEQITLPRAADVVVDPDDVPHDVSGVELFDAAITPGIYRVLSNDRIIGAFVVNPAETESELRYADPRRVERNLRAFNVKRVESAAAWQRNIYSSRVGREVWRVLLVLLLVLLAVEAFAAATGVRRAAPPPVAAEV